MAAGRKLRECPEKPIRVNVFVTQSIHKTLSAMRQGSMIHVLRANLGSEPLTGEEKAEEIAFENAMNECFNALVTTSPNLHILASLDIARMQANIDGFDLLARAQGIARWIRSRIQGGAGKPGARRISVLSEEQLIPLELQRSHEAALDPLKVTLYSPDFVGGDFRKAELWERFGIQINKYTHNTVLLLVTIGTTLSMAERLLRAIEKWREAPAPLDPEIGKTGNVSSGKLEIPAFSGFASDWSVDGDSRIGRLGEAFRYGFSAERIELVPFGSVLEGRVSATFVTPYPPGYPILVPGQVIRAETLGLLENIMQHMKLENIHGVVSGGILVFKDDSATNSG